MQRLIARGAVVAVGLSVVSGCADNAPPPPPPAERVDNPAAGTAERPSNLSYGTVTGTVKKNVTTQAELLEMFGGPNVSTTDANGLETWVYERSSSMSDTAGATQDKQFNAFFGIGAAGGGVAAGGGAGGGSRSSADQRRTVNSTRNLTVIVKFNEDKTVKDYSVRAAQF